MAIYGDGKHNENMEYNGPKYVVTDKTVYRTTHWRVECNDDTYFVQCQEGDMYDTWFIESDEEGSIDPESQLGHDLITTCEIYEDWNMDNDDRFDDEDGGYGTGAK